MRKRASRAKIAPLERNLQATAIRKLKAIQVRDRAFTFRKRHGSVMGVAGDPDLYGLWLGLHWELELKTRGNPTKLQNMRREEWNRAGAFTGVAASPDGVDLFLFRLEALVRARGS